MNWAEVLTIITTMSGLTLWLDHKHDKSIDKMDERWKWLYEKLDGEIKEISAQWMRLYEKLDAKIDRVKDSTMGSIHGESVNG